MLNYLDLNKIVDCCPFSSERWRFLSAQNLLEEFFIERLLVHGLDTHTFEMLTEIWSVIRRQEHERWQHKRTIQFSLFQGVESFHLLQDLDPIFEWHLEVQEHDGDRLQQSGALNYLINRLLDNDFYEIDRFLTVDCETRFLLETKRRELVLDNLQVY